MKAILLVCAFGLSLLSAEPPAERTKAEKKVTSVDDRKVMEAARDAAAKAYKVAVKARQEGNIIDPDPEGANVIPEPQGRPETERYLKLKKEYLSARAAMEKAERESRRKHSDF